MKAELETFMTEAHIEISSKTPDTLEEILELPEIVDNLNSTNNTSLVNYKINSRIASSLSECSQNTLSESSSFRKDSESSDLLNTSFSSTELTNFDIAEYVFEENKQTKKSIENTEPVIVKQEPNLDEEPVDIKPVDLPKRTIKAGMKKIDLKAQKYIIDEDIKKSFSEDECDIDIETVSEEESSPVLEAGNLTDLLEQFEATEVQNKEHINNSDQQNVNLNVKVQVKTEKAPILETSNKSVIKIEPKIEIKPVKIKQEKPDIVKPIKIEPGK